MRDRARQEEIEKAYLEPWAEKSAASVGRLHPEQPHPFRTAFQRDRARIVHSKAFRRLEYKTQVFLNGTGDHFRTRLTHTMEVASISRSIAQALGLNADLAETIALAHDLGHPPFGHSGEVTLDRIMQGHGGFEHNKQSLRVVGLLEKKYPGFNGLNLSWEVLEGIDKHGAQHSKPGGCEVFPQPSLEAQIANLADEIAYYSHDIDDGIDSGLISTEQLLTLNLWRETIGEVRARYQRLQGSRLIAYTIRCLIDHQVEDVIRASSTAITRAKLTSPDDARRQSIPLIRLSKQGAAENRKLRRFLHQNLYHSDTVSEMNTRACEMLEKVFDSYLNKPRLLPIEFRKRIPSEGVHRPVCDYISGMTDRYLIGEHQHLTRLGKEL